MEVHPFVCCSHESSKHSPEDCPGLHQLFRILQDPTIQENQVTVLSRTSNRYSKDDGFAEFLCAAAKEIHPRCQVRAAGGFCHPIATLRKIDNKRIAANKELGNHSNVTDTLERLDENEEKQADINALALSLKKNDPESLLPIIESACNHNGVLSEDHCSRLRTYTLARFAEVEDGSTTVQDAVTATHSFIHAAFMGQVLSPQLLNAVWAIYNRVYLRQRTHLV